MEFAVEVIRAPEISDCKEGLFNPVTKAYSKEELTFRMTEEDFTEFLEMLKEYE